ncbi:MAG: hypothetical protein FWD05_06610 [Oscillospiraceae bacterium]|nr:hypothetical protein [Oscillospiraceae bacterium]
MKKIKLLHLYHDLMNLYGDWANVAILEHSLTVGGCDVLVDKKSVGDDINFDSYDFIYIGSGTERSQLACVRDLKQYRKQLIGCIEAEVPVLATGNSHELFGKAITDSNGAKHEMLGLLDFETVQLNTRVTGDCVCKVSFLTDKLIGFINRAGGSQNGDVERPFLIEPKEGASFKASGEGIRYKNLLGTYLTGPLLVRNPPLLRYFANLITDESKDIKKYENDALLIYQEKAYISAVEML